MLKHLLAAALVAAFSSHALAQGADKPKASLTSEVSQQFPDNITGAITPSNARNVTNDIIASTQQAPTVNAQTGTSYTFQVSDYGLLVTFNNAGAISVTLPETINTSNTFYPWNVYVANLGAGTVTITPTGSTINGASKLTVPTGGSFQIVSDGTNYQIAAGAVTAASVSFKQTGSNSVVDTVNSKFLNIIYSASDWGITCNGTTDDTTTFNNAITDINANGGGILQLPTGTCIGEGITLRPFVTIAGQGRSATFIQGRNGTTGAVLLTLNFSSLTGSNTEAGPNAWGLRDLTIDGNKANRASGDDIDIYGYDYTLFNVDFRNAPAIGIYSEWATSPTCPGPFNNCMEARLLNVRSFNNGGNGITWNGPHDSQWVNVLPFINGGTGTTFGGTANYSAVGTTLTHYHTYGNGGWGIVTNVNLFGNDVQSESNTTGDIQINSGGAVNWAGVEVYDTPGPGVQINSTSNVISGLGTTGHTGSSGDGVQITANNNIITGLFSSGNSESGVNLESAGNYVQGLTSSNLSAINFTSDTGLNQVKLINSQSSGNVFFSNNQPSASDAVDVTSTGVGLSFHQRPGTTTSDSAQAGNVGEYISGSVGQGSPVTLSSGTPANITSISLTGGDWDVSGNFYVIPSGTPTITLLASSLSATTGSMNTANGANVQAFTNLTSAGAFATGGYGVGPFRVSISATTTYYLVGQCNFTAGTSPTCGGYGIIRARRVR